MKGGTTVKFFNKVFLVISCPIKKVKVSEVRSSWFILQETTAYKRKTCGNLRTAGISSSPATHSDSVTILLYQIIIAQSYNRDIEYSIS